MMKGSAVNILAIVGSPRKGKSTDALVDQAIVGAKSLHPDINVTKLHLADYDIKYCKNCLACRDNQTDKPFANCTIDDDMGYVFQEIVKSDALILGTPVHMGTVTALMMAFLERICWTFAKPEGKILFINECPVPRTTKKRKAVIIITSGIVPPLLRRFCDDATPLIKRTISDSLNAKTVGDMYAGDVEHRGAESYFEKAKMLGRKLATSM
jgi:NAD(P)H-dependent FMN reductase